MQAGAADFLAWDELDSRSLERAISHAFERKRAESDLRNSEVRFRALFEQSPNPICIHRSDGLSVRINQSVLDRFSMTREQAARYNVLQDRHLLAQSDGMGAIHKAFSGEAATVPLIKFSSDEHGWANEELTRWLKGVAYPIKDQAGEVDEVVLIWEDVTAQEEAEIKLRQTESQYQSIFKATTDGLVINAFGKVVEVNSAFAEMHGYSCEEMIGMDPGVFVHPDSMGLVREFFEAVQAGKQYYCEAVDVRKDGSLFPVEVHGTTFTYRGEAHVLGIIRDITERMQARELLEQRVEERTRALATLLEVSSNVASTMELEPLLERILEQLKLAATYSRSSIMVQGESDSETIFMNAWGYPTDAPLPPNLPSSPAQFGPLSERMLRGEAIVVADVHSEEPEARLLHDAIEAALGASDPETAELLRAIIATEHSMLFAPMLLKDKIIGGLTLRHNEAGFYTERHADLAKALANQAAVAVENSRLLAQAHDKARLEERQRLARELHDSVTQALFSTNLIARSLEVILQREGTHSPDAMDKIADLRQLTQGALAEMRALIFELRPGALEEEGLMEALRKHAAGIQGRQELQVGVIGSGEGVLPRLKPAAEEALYRIAQEALHNVVKHARATRVEISIGASDGFVTMQVSDNGIGFDVQEVRAGHMGLGTMGQRAGALQAEYLVSSHLGAVASVTVRVPLNACRSHASTFSLAQEVSWRVRT